ncbi:hypothetical protein B0H66DRAFT_251957 [Apodospora peruviana]|uniref:Yeast cell wall synthesis Kre9/Knh1-like N-terminal domain-containing protein n=1 Tax=Apodospora peruviana TaxID=516989 RepID=A0AAE0M5Q3_9PEZI|nr:hypothetical protein B0H66DRAFT_251957 [Apodospora peruviana]
MKFFATIAAFAAAVSAIQITEPKANAAWDLSVSNKIKWTFVTSDAEEFRIDLIDHSTSPETSKTIVAKAKRDDGEATITNVSAKPGSKYNIKFIALDTKENSGQLAESQQFNVTKSGVESTTTSAPTGAPTGGSNTNTATTSSSTAGAGAIGLGVAGPVAGFLLALIA